MKLVLLLRVVSASFRNRSPSPSTSEGSETDLDCKDERNVSYHRSEVLFYKRDEDMKLVFDQLLEGEIPRLYICYESDAYNGIAKVDIKEREGFQKGDDKLHESIYLFMKQERYKDGKQKGSVVWLDIDLCEKARTKLVRVPMIYSTSRVTKFDYSTYFNDCVQAPSMLFDILIKIHYKKLPEGDKKRCISKLREFGKLYPIQIETPFTKGGHIFVWFEHNYEKLPPVCRDLATMLENEKKFNTKALLGYLARTFEHVYKNKYLPLEGHRGTKIRVDMESNEMHWVATRYAFVNDCLNLIKFATDEKSTSDIYEIYDIETVGQLNVVHAFLFNFAGCECIEKEDTSVLTEEGKEINYFETFVFKNDLYVVIKKSDLFEKHINSITIRFDLRRVVYVTDPIDVRCNKK